jgi:hypothetical protein
VQVHFENKEGRIENLKREFDKIAAYCEHRGYIPNFTTVIGADLNLTATGTTGALKPSTKGGK